MAGIGISAEKKWFSAKWILFYLLELLKEKFPNDSSLDKAIKAGLIDGTNWLNLEDVPNDQLELFKAEVFKIFEDLKRQGPSCLSSPEFYPGFIEKISELIEVLEE